MPPNAGQKPWAGNPEKGMVPQYPIGNPRNAATNAARWQLNRAFLVQFSSESSRF
jgi:hypothetical protein